MKNLKRILFGYDFFISYSRKDGAEYASKLANCIINEGYSCFIDQWGSDPGKSLPNKLKGKIKQSSTFILLVTNEALNSIAISEEIDIFLSTNRTIVPVNFGSIEKAIWFSKIEGIAFSKEKEVNISLTDISNDIIDRIKNSFTYTKQTNRIRNTAISAVIIIAIASIFVFYSFYQAKVSELAKNKLAVEIGISEAKLKDNLAELEVIKSELSTTQKLKDSVQNQLEENRKNLVSIKEEMRDLTNKKRMFEIFASKINDDAIFLLQESQQQFESFLTSVNNIEELKSSCQNNVENKITEYTLYFDFDKYSINVETQYKLEMIIKLLSECPTLKIALTTFSYKFLSEKENLNFFKMIWIEGGDDPNIFGHKYVSKFNERRRSTVKDYLEAKGIDLKRVFHYDKFVFDRRDVNKLSQEEKAMMRRIEIKFYN